MATSKGIKIFKLGLPSLEETLKQTGRKFIDETGRVEGRKLRNLRSQQTCVSLGSHWAEWERQRTVCDLSVGDFVAHLLAIHESCCPIYCHVNSLLDPRNDSDAEHIEVKVEPLTSPNSNTNDINGHVQTKKRKGKCSKTHNSSSTAVETNYETKIPPNLQTAESTTIPNPVENSNTVFIPEVLCPSQVNCLQSDTSTTLHGVSNKNCHNTTTLMGVDESEFQQNVDQALASEVMMYNINSVKSSTSDDGYGLFKEPSIECKSQQMVWNSHNDKKHTNHSADESLFPPKKQANDPDLATKVNASSSQQDEPVGLNTSDFFPNLFFIESSGQEQKSKSIETAVQSITSLRSQKHDRKIENGITNNDMNQLYEGSDFESSPSNSDDYTDEDTEENTVEDFKEAKKVFSKQRAQGTKSKSLKMRKCTPVEAKKPCYNDSFQCDKCSLEYHYSWASVVAHKRQEHPVEEVACDICDAVCHDEALLSTHMMKVHAMSSLPERRLGYLACPDCNECHLTALSYIFHREDKHECCVLTCMLCKYVVDHRFQMKTHMFHSHDLNNFAIYSTYISSEMTTKRRKKYRDYSGNYYFDRSRCSCAMCGESFTDNPRPLRASIRHIKEKHADQLKQQVFQCCVCKKVMTNLTSLNIHYKNIHFSSDIQCDFCQISHIGSANHIRHVQRIHCGIRTAFCEECNLIFFYPKELRHHTARVHNDVRAFLCDTCGRGFKTNAALRVHRQIHSGEKPILCAYCAYRCRQKNALNWHMKRNHPDMVALVEPVATGRRRGKALTKKNSNAKEPNSAQ